jgi:atypical dual specificity phosphatase
MDGVTTLTLDIEDVRDQQLDFDRVLGFIQQALSSPQSVVFVHCAMGVSRSASFIIAHILKTEGITLEAAVESVQAIRIQV